MNKTIHFWKMNAAGNDFVVVDNRQKILSEEELNAFTKTVCERRRSIGADGTLFVEQSPDPAKYDFRMRYFNADGGEAEMCGNGARCISKFAEANGIAKKQMTFLTMAGPVSANVTAFGIKLLLSPANEAANPEMFNVRKHDSFPLSGAPVTLYTANTGVPHTVMFVDDLDTYPIIEHGSALRYHEAFQPSGTNANFITPIPGKNAIRIRTYERGVEDETLACGTGSTASGLVANFAMGLASPIEVHTRGGVILLISFERGEGASYRGVHLEGPATKVFEADYVWE